MTKNNVSQKKIILKIFAKNVNAARSRAVVTWPSKLHSWETKSDKKVSKNGF